MYWPAHLAGVSGAVPAHGAAAAACMRRRATVGAATGRAGGAMQVRREVACRPPGAGRVPHALVRIALPLLRALPKCTVMGNLVVRIDRGRAPPSSACSWPSRCCGIEDSARQSLSRYCATVSSLEDVPNRQLSGEPSSSKVTMTRNMVVAND